MAFFHKKDQKPPSKPTTAPVVIGRSDLFGDFKHFKQDNRPKKDWWAPGEYTNKCRTCGDHFIGDKRAGTCADCAHGERVECHWLYDEDICSYTTQCGDPFFIPDGTREENKIKFCPFCGLKITELK